MVVFVNTSWDRVHRKQRSHFFAFSADLVTGFIVFVSAFVVFGLFFGVTASLTAGGFLPVVGTFVAAGNSGERFLFQW